MVPSWLSGISDKGRSNRVMISDGHISEFLSTEKADYQGNSNQEIVS